MTNALISLNKIGNGKHPVYC